MFASIMQKLLFFVFLCLIVASDVDAQRRRPNRNKRPRLPPACHWKDIDKCMDGMEALGKRPQASNIMTTDAGLSELCKTVNESITCMKAFAKKCSTPLQRDFFEFLNEDFVESVNQFCNTPSARKTFLQHSPCINSKVLTKKAYHKNCVNDLFAAFDKGQKLANTTLDDPEFTKFEKSSEKSLADKLLDLTCCSHNRFAKCTNDLIVKDCGQPAVDAMSNFSEKTFGKNVKRMCPKKMFRPAKPICKDILPAPGSSPKTADLKKNLIGKYMLTYLNFIFNFDGGAGR